MGPKPKISPATKLRVVDAYVNGGVQQKDLAKAYRVDPSTIKRWVHEAEKASAGEP